MAKHEIVSQDPSAARFELGPPIRPIPLFEQLQVIVHYRLFVATVALSVTALGALYAYAKPRTYEANLLIEVSDMRSIEPKSLLGYATPGATFKRAMSEVELLRSRAIVGAAIDRLGLEVAAAPVRFPVIGSMVAAWNTRHDRARPPAFGGYAWGDERIQVAYLLVPEALQGASLTVTKTGAARFLAEDEESGARVRGQVGQPQHLAVGGQTVTFRIDELTGATGTRYAMSRTPRVLVIDELSSALAVTELGKDTGMIRVSLRHTDPLLAKRFLNEMGQVYMDVVKGQRGKEAGAALEVLDARLPLLKKRVALAEARYEAFRRHERATDLAEDTRLQLGRYAETKTRLSELRQKRAELGVRLGDEHPELRALDQQIAGVSRDSEAVAGDMRRLPAMSTELDRLARELKAETDIYGAVLRRVEEMRVDALDRSSNVRIVDEAVVPVRAAESRLMVVLFAAALGLGLGVVGAFFRRMRASVRRDSVYQAEESEEHLPSRYAHARG